MRKIYLESAVAVVSLLPLTGCIDDNYDLSDIDTTSELKVTDLVVPVNLSSITLDNIIEVDEDDENATIVLYPKEPAEGVEQIYAVRKSGDFHSDDKVIADISTDISKAIEPTVQTLTAENLTDRRMSRASSTGVRYPINKRSTWFEYKVENIDPAIRSLNSVTTSPLDIKIRLFSNTIESVAERVVFSNLAIQLPKGLKVTCDAKEWIYDKNSGVLTVKEVTGDGHSAQLIVTLSEIDFKANNVQLQNHSFDFRGVLGINSGMLTLFPKSQVDLSSVPRELTFTMTYDLSTLFVTSFCGDIDYSLDGVNINPVNLNDLPDFLAGDQTSLQLSNPQLLLNVTNPVGPYNVECTTGLGIKRIWPETQSSLNPLTGVVIDSDKGTGPYEVLIATDPDNTYPGTTPANAKKYAYPELSNLLKGNGLPSQLQINLVDPKLSGNARNFPVGNSSPIPGVKGSYEFFTPLSLDPQSTIVYSKEEKDWNDEDVDKIKITTFKVNAIASTDLPCGIRIKVAPLVKDPSTGEIRVFGESSQVAITSFAKDEPIEIIINCSKENPILHLDGIRYEAIATSEDGTPLDPKQNIKLDKIRVTVTGTYTTDF